ncbi:hypothetical protein JXB31_01200, partial [Candidatus Woesearchaeota archaeon]|nr:hypothetical protein [Candidatus Woesearchaeota archaeon]
FKKKIKEFLTDEEGKITKQSMLIAGGAVVGIAAGSISAKLASAGDISGPCDPGSDPSSCYTHKNSGDYTSSGDGHLRVSHNHHYNHGSHASHGSHSSY